MKTSLFKSAFLFAVLAFFSTAALAQKKMASITKGLILPPHAGHLCVRQKMAAWYMREIVLPDTGTWCSSNMRMDISQRMRIWIKR